MKALQTGLTKLCWTAFAGVSAYAIFAVLSVAIYTGSWGGRLLLLAVLALVLAGAFTMRQTVVRAANALADELDAIPRHRFVTILVLLGIALRVAWLLFAGTEPWSDYLAYWQLAQSLAEGGPYFNGSRYAYLPPGLPLLLAPFIVVIGQTAAAYIVANLLLFIAACLVLWRLASMLFDERVARLALLLLVVWPNYWMLANLPNKEMALVMLLPLGVLLYLTALRSERRGKRLALLVASGAALGMASLCQPTALLFASVFACAAIMLESSALKSVGRLAVVCIAMAVTVAPWIVRNYHLFGVVAVSSAAGESLYNGAHDGSGGGWSSGIREKYRALSHLSEMEASDALRREAMDWIKSHPVEFAILAVKKQFRLLGDDASGAYSALSAPNRPAGAGSDLFVWVSNIFWLMLWIVILYGLFPLGRLMRGNSAYAVLLALHLLYFFGLHSIYQSESRHKISAYIPLAILAASIVDGRARRESAGVMQRAPAEPGRIA